MRFEQLSGYQLREAVQALLETERCKLLAISTRIGSENRAYITQLRRVLVLQQRLMQLGQFDR